MTDHLIKYYEEKNNEDLRLSLDRAHSIEYLTTIRYFDRVFPAGSAILDACAGTGAYAFYLAEKGHKVTAGDLVPHNVAIMEEKQRKNPVLQDIYTGSIFDLFRFPDHCFDVVLNMGALYHLVDENERKQVVRESLRVLKNGGIYVVTYINRHANILKYRHEMKGNLNKFIYYAQNGCVDNERLFYSSTPEEMISLMDSVGVTVLHHVGADGVGYLMHDIIESLDPQEYEKWLDYHFTICETGSLLGYSEHGLYIGRKA